MSNIDYESAVEVLSIIDGGLREIEHTVSKALAITLARKIGKPSPDLPADEDTSLSAKFQRFFDILFNVQPEIKPLTVEEVIKLVDEAIAAFEERENEPLRHGEDYETDRHNYRDYADEYREMRKFLVDGKINEAINSHRMMDTFVRGYLYSNDPRIDFQLSVFLDDGGFV